MDVYDALPYMQGKPCLCLVLLSDDDLQNLRNSVQLCSQRHRVGCGGAGGEEYSKYKQQVVDMLKAGQLVVQMLAAEETISMPDGSRKATFTQETWDMVTPTPYLPPTHSLPHPIPTSVLTFITQHVACTSEKAGTSWFSSTQYMTCTELMSVAQV